MSPFPILRQACEASSRLHDLDDGYIHLSVDELMGEMLDFFGPGLGGPTLADVVETENWLLYLSGAAWELVMDSSSYFLSNDGVSRICPELGLPVPPNVANVLAALTEMAEPLE